MFAHAPPTVARVDLRRYLGRWFEVARLPMRFQDEACTDVLAEYSLGEDGSVCVCNRCTQCDGHHKTASGIATPVDDSNARLKVSFMPEGLRWVPFTRGDYWVLRLDPGYTVSLVGTPNRHHLWLLARTRTPDPAMRDDALAYAASLGYDLTSLIHTPHGRATADRDVPHSAVSRH